MLDTMPSRCPAHGARKHTTHAGEDDASHAGHGRAAVDQLRLHIPAQFWRGCRQGCMWQVCTRCMQLASQGSGHASIHSRPLRARTAMCHRARVPRPHTHASFGGSPSPLLQDAASHFPPQQPVAHQRSASASLPRPSGSKPKSPARLRRSIRACRGRNKAREGEHTPVTRSSNQARRGPCWPARMPGHGCCACASARVRVGPSSLPSHPPPSILHPLAACRPGGSPQPRGSGAQHLRAVQVGRSGVSRQPERARR